MSRCTNPIYALDRGIKENGKRDIKILPRRVDLYSYQTLSERYGKGSIIPLPCGKCLACKLNKAKEWAVRCCLEASLYENNYFVTLTYSDGNLPVGGTLQRDHVQSFLKRLRYYSPGLRYFGCGEYGSHTKRPHYHLILFNLDLPDLKCVSKGSIGGYYYQSKLLEEVWSKGNILIGEVSYSSASYVARYATKKLFGDQNSSEFICMSTRPGLGYGWFEKHPEVFQYDSIVGNFGSSKVSKIPRYFEKMVEKLGVEIDLSDIKDERICQSNDALFHKLNVHGFTNLEMIYEYDGSILNARFEDMKRRKDL